MEKWDRRGPGPSIIYGLTCVLPDSYVEILTLVPHNVALFGSWVFADLISSDEVIRVGLIRSDWCPPEKGNFGHRDTQGEHRWKMSGELRARIAKYCPRVTRSWGRPGQTPAQP